MNFDRLKAIYVITTPDRFPNKIFKIGRTTQSQEDLRKRYKTSLIEPIILSYLPVPDEIKAEAMLHDALKMYKLSNSEWFQCELGIIMTEVCKLQIYEEAKISDQMNTQNSNMQDESGTKGVMVDYERKSEFRKLYYWLTHDTVFSDFLIMQEKPYIRGFYKLEKENFWRPLRNKATFKNTLYKLLKNNLFTYPPFHPSFYTSSCTTDFSQSQNVSNTKPKHIVENPFLLMKSVKMKSFYRLEIFSEKKYLDKNFLEDCTKAITFISMDRTIGDTEKSFLHTTYEENKIYFLEGEVLKYIDCAGSANFSPKINHNMKIVISQNIWEKSQLESCNIFQSSEPEYQIFSELMGCWIPNKAKLELFRNFGKACIQNKVFPTHLFQKSKIGSFFEPTYKDEGKGKSHESTDEFIEPINSELGDNTLVAELLFLVMNTFFSGSVFRFKAEINSWEGVKTFIQNIPKNEKQMHYAPRLLLIYTNHFSGSVNSSNSRSGSVTSSSGSVNNSVNFGSAKNNNRPEIMCNTTQWYDFETCFSERVKCEPNVIVIQKEQLFNQYLYKEDENLIPPANMAHIEFFRIKYPNFIESICSPEKVFLALKWFLHSE